MLKTEAEKKQKKITVEDVQYITGIFGNDDKYMEMIGKAFGVTMVLRGDELVITGDDADHAENTVLDMMWVLERGDELDEQRAEYIIALNREGKSYRNSRLSKDILCFTHRGKPVRAKTLGQINYANNIRENDVVFGVGPAGTGKTYLAVAMAVNAFKNKEVQKIILARPAVEAGENLGFLPGDLQEKVDPYLRPLYDALFDILGRDAALRLKEKEMIEVVPLAYMRGRTLDNAFIILDEAQNSTREQMKMFLTRLGFGSKAVVTGDVTQIDLPRKKMSGLRDALRILKGVEGISFSFFDGEDVVRHPLVKRIIKAYELDDEERERREQR
ncbi:MAG: PhoH family protein [Anaerovoracaceae bacterium]|nr:PhoH family protein [Bacillota bacterium]MDY5905529.1 PhoH family protein [Anaerovoracaceae bacterium]